MAAKTTVAAANSQQTAAEIAYLTRAFKAPTLRDCVDRLAEQARAEGWTHEQYLAAGSGACSAALGGLGLPRLYQPVPHPLVTTILK